MVGFAELGLSPWLVEALETLRISEPTAVQRACIPAILGGRDVVGCAETGSGKTCAFALPILQRLGEDPMGIFALILSPTRELATQIALQLRALGAGIGLRLVLVIGGVDEMSQAAALEAGPHVVVGTPGRLEELLRRGVGTWDRVRFVVIDEADRVLSEYGEQTKSVVEKCGQQRQMCLFSATMTKGLERALEVGKDIFRFDEKTEMFRTVQTLKQEYCFMPPRLRMCYLVHILNKEEVDKNVIVFVSKCYTAELLCASLKIFGVTKVAAMHSEMKQSTRLQVLQKFKGRTVRVLIATDLASRGLDIPSVALVVNYNIPKRATTYIHRVGRTARAGRKGLALNFITPFDIELVHAIEDKIGQKFEKYEGAPEREVMEGLSDILKAERVAILKLQDSGFATRCELRHEVGKAKALKKRKREQASDKEKKLIERFRKKLVS